MTEQKNYSILVTRTIQERVLVQASNEEEARIWASGMVKGGGRSSSTTEVVASWPTLQEENGPVVPGEGFFWRRGWFWAASLDFRTVALPTILLPGLPLEGSPAEKAAVHRRFSELIQGKNETIFSIRRVYGHAFLKNDDVLGVDDRSLESVLRHVSLASGDVLWDGPFVSEKDMLNAANSEVRRRDALKREAVRAAQEAENERRLEMVAEETIAIMRRPENEDALYKTRGGRWSVGTIIASSTDADGALTPEAWSVDIHIVRRLLETGRAQIRGAYEASGDPYAISLLWRESTSNYFEK
ncbi:hypothetical protein KIKIMORA_00930 [Brevundimonas phage vB_BpoS-Kikimora]|uniref:Uncharacterized protein n=1 Tax=Brevundimonas phage vB_BpoS-Kikimora TaxID=2948601 RepID=A0A9E7MRR5_9CAUD|nr:hypothetical protein KIKIMORA_00930 [Brevundimonas phage vB_BpoS-Kikimora]